MLSLSGGGLVDLVRVEPAALPIVPIGGPGLVENRARVGETSSGKGKKGLFREVPSSAPLGAWSPGTEALAGAPMEGNVSLRGEVPVTVSSVAPELRARSRSYRDRFVWALSTSNDSSASPQDLTRSLDMASFCDQQLGRSIQRHDSSYEFRLYMIRRGIIKASERLGDLGNIEQYVRSAMRATCEPNGILRRSLVRASDQLLDVWFPNSCHFHFVASVRFCRAA